jgi:hypothetical protein
MQLACPSTAHLVAEEEVGVAWPAANNAHRLLPLQDSSQLLRVDTIQALESQDNGHQDDQADGFRRMPRCIQVRWCRLEFLELSMQSAPGASCATTAAPRGRGAAASECWRVDIHLTNDRRSQVWVLASDCNIALSRT